MLYTVLPFYCQLFKVMWHVVRSVGSVCEPITTLISLYSEFLNKGNILWNIVYEYTFYKSGNCIAGRHAFV